MYSDDGAAASRPADHGSFFPAGTSSVYRRMMQDAIPLRALREPVAVGECARGGPCEARGAPSTLAARALRGGAAAGFVLGAGGASRAHSRSEHVAFCD